MGNNLSPPYEREKRSTVEYLMGEVEKHNPPSDINTLIKKFCQMHKGYSGLEEELRTIAEDLKIRSRR